MSQKNATNVFIGIFCTWATRLAVKNICWSSKMNSLIIVNWFPCTTPTSSIAATTLLDWYKRFGMAHVWQSDCGSHFVNNVIKELESRLKFKQVITPVYAPWLNGTIERLNRDILTVMRTLLLEFQLHSREWVYLVPIVQSNLNHSPMASLCGAAPIELFTGLPRPSVLSSIVVPGRNNENHQVISIDDFPAKIEDLRRSLAECIKM